MPPDLPTLRPDLAQLLRIIHLIPGLDRRAYANSQTPMKELRHHGLVTLSGTAVSWRGIVTLTPRGLAYLEAHDLHRFGHEPDPTFALAIAKFEAARQAYHDKNQPKELA